MAQSMVTVKGINETLAALKAFPKNLRAMGYVKALSRATGIMRYEVDHLCPVEDIGFSTVAMAVPGHSRTSQSHPGDLKRALTVDIALDAEGKGGHGDVGFYGFQGSVALWVNLGHRIVTRGGTYIDSRGRKRKGSVNGFVPGNPFLQRAFNLTADEVIEAVAISLEETVNTVVPTAP